MKNLPAYFYIIAGYPLTKIYEDVLISLIRPTPCRVLSMPIFEREINNRQAGLQA
jgi:hypothetical protein